MRARHYATVGGQWTSLDPILHFIATRLGSGGVGINSSLHNYTYSYPVSSVDPSGWEPESGTKGYNDENHGIVDNCIHFWMPFHFPGIFSHLEVRFDFCMEIFDITCCRPPVAKQCQEGKLVLELTLGIPGDLGIDKIEEEVMQVIKTIGSIFASMLNMGLAQLPIKDCREPEHKYTFEFCIGVCVGLYTIEFCVGTDGTHLNNKFGWCGLPRVDLTGSASLKDCH